MVISSYGFTVMGALVAGVKPGMLAVMRVVPGATAVNVAEPELPALAPQTTVLVMVPTDGTELVHVTVNGLAGYWFVE